MPPKLHTILAGAALAAVAFPAWAVAPETPRPLYREGEVIVKYRPGAQAAGRQLHANLGLVPLRALLRGRAEHLRLPAFLTVEGALPLLQQDAAVEYAEPNFLRYPRAAIPNDPLFDLQWGLRNTGQPNFFDGGPAGVPGADLNLAEAWDADGDGTADRVGDPAVIVAVIDDAVDTGHEDLAGNLVPGFNFVGGNDNPNPGDGQVHGTFVAGCVAAKGNNGIGVAGVAWNVKIMPLKFDFDEASHLAALEFARLNGASIINASFGGPGFSQAERDAIDDLRLSDILYVAAAGNDDSNTDVAELNYPANYDADNIVSVAATNRQDDIASFSQYGPRTIDVAAPGLQIVTTRVDDLYTNSGVSGTSFSSPYAAGIAALIRSHVAGVTWRDIKARLIESGSAVSGANPQLRTAGGRIDADRALELADGPSLVIESVTLTGGDGNGRLDPGEALTLTLGIRNIWNAATNATAALGVASPLTLDDATPVALADLDPDAVATASFPVTVDPGLAGHAYVPVSVTLAADGYSTVRSLILEAGHLDNGLTVTQAFAPRDVDLYDEFHAWNFDLAALPAGHTQLVIKTTSSAPGRNSPDIDLLVKRDVPPQYSITVGINPETDDGFFCTSGTASNCRDPATRVSADEDGKELVVYNNPAPGTYHIVVVNFAQLDDGMTYTLSAFTRPAPKTPAGGGGGAPAPGVLLLFLAAALARRSSGR
jgi:hypothetical protein